MFNFLKEKLKGALSRFTKKVEETPEEKKEAAPEKPKIVKVAPTKKSALKLEKKPEIKAEKPEVVTPKIKLEEPVELKPEPIKSVKLEVPKPEPKVEVKAIEPKGFLARVKEKFSSEPAPEKVEEKGFFTRITEKITTKKITVEQFDGLFWDLELALLENNVAVEVIEKIKVDLKSELVDTPLPRGKIEEAISQTLHKSLDGLFETPSIDLLSNAKAKKPLIICFVGVNGSGKTTSIAKVAHYLQSQGLSVVLAAADTFRAAAIDQLQLHADNLKIKLVRHDYGSDPAAVAFDAIKHAEATKKDIVLIDTAGRLHSNINLVDEMKKIVRVAKPDLKIFVGESITGNDCVEQAKKFDEAIGIDGIILAKADVDEKGGAAISVSYVTKKPILFLGVGQEYKDLQVFDKEKLLASIGL